MSQDRRDVVERLREVSCEQFECEAIAEEAAREIETLRARIDDKTEIIRLLRARPGRSEDPTIVVAHYEGGRKWIGPMFALPAGYVNCEVYIDDGGPEPPAAPGA